MDVLFSIFELLGTVAFAVSGAMEGVRHRMDLFGVTLLGLVTAIGGGVLRDLVIGQIPPKVFRDSRCAVLAILVALAVFIILKLTQERKPRALARLRDRLYFLSDTLGLAAFTVLGIESAGPGRNTGLLLFVGMITGVGGGVLRDILAGSVPSILRKHIYAVASLAGALADVLLMHILPAEIAMLAGFVLVVLIRLAAAHYKWNLPHIDLDEDDAED